ncbi:MAG: phosphate acyltransferase, partial [Candidatus Omnitrophota bacterium]
MLEIINTLRQKAKQNLKTIVLPEGNDPRVRQAVEIIASEKIAKTIVLSPENLDPQKYEAYAQEYFELRKHRGLSLTEAKQMLKDPLYVAAMMVKMGDADGFVAGAANTTPDVVRAAIHCLGVDSKIGCASSSFIMVVPDCDMGWGGTFVFADCGVIPFPTAQELASIALATADLAKTVLKVAPKVAMLSYSTKGSAKGESVGKIREAIALVKNAAPDLIIDGELQVDSAIVSEVAKLKGGNDILNGEANVLIFPNLDAGNISYKLVNRLGHARA